MNEATIDKFSSVQIFSWNVFENLNVLIAMMIAILQSLSYFIKWIFAMIAKKNAIVFAAKKFYRKSTIKEKFF